MRLMTIALTLSALAAQAQDPVFSPKALLEQARQNAAKTVLVADEAPVAGAWEPSVFEKAAIEKARQLLLENQDRFPGRTMKEEDLPPVFYVSATQDTAIVRFGPQTHQGIAIDGTQIQVRLIANRMDRKRRDVITGKWVEIPAGLSTTPQSTEAKARDSLKGLKLNISDVLNEPSYMTLGDADLTQPGQLAYVLDSTGKPRLVWKIIAGQAVQWELYVDTENGQVLRKKQFFDSPYLDKRVR